MKTIECVDCGESVPYGRLSCPACGALLASVAGGRARVVPAASAAVPDGFRTGVPRSVATVPPVAAAAPLPPAPLPPARAVEPLFPDPPGAMPSFWPPLEERPDPVLAPRPYRTPAWATVPDPEMVDPAMAEPTMAEPTMAEPAMIAPVMSDVALTPSWASVALAPEPPFSRAAVPGAYRPAFSLAAAGPSVALPAWSDAAPSARGASMPRMPRTVGRAQDIAIDAARFSAIAVWFVVVGSALAVLGFFLPWSQTVIGAASYGDYFDAWGLASPTHWFVLASLLLVLALGVVQTKVPVWLRTGTLGLGLGALLVGLVWPYVVGPLGADIGVLCVGFGGVAMVIGGAVASWSTRHVGVEPVV